MTLYTLGLYRGLAYCCLILILTHRTRSRGFPLTLSRCQCCRRLPKKQGYKTSPGSALSADDEANTGTRSAAREEPRGLARLGWPYWTATLQTGP